VISAARYVLRGWFYRLIDHLVAWRLNQLRQKIRS